ncbi:MAG: ABC transporter ATP-binding protein [Acidimicrobiia bacterium]|nr:ABC transporter ATP-binding protein [Acidimicrobiia bacterium]
MTDSIVTTKGLSFAYGDIVALSDVTLEVPQGTVGLVGANGAGKTTLIKLLLGILPSADGSIDVLGHSVNTDRLAVRSQVGFMPEGDCMPKDQSAADFIGYAAELAGLPTRAARQRASDVLTLVGLHEERFRRMVEFSTGMMQRAKMAQALVHDPTLVLLDEPTAGLDPEGREDMLDLIERLHGFGISVLVSSHVLTDIERTCDWVVMLDGGKVLRSEPISALSQTGVVELELFEDPAPVGDALQRAGAEVRIDGTRLLVQVAAGDPFSLIQDALVSSGAGVRRLGARSTSLEDIFLREGSETGEGSK